MYKRHFNLTALPFSLTPNTSLFFNEQSHRIALNTLLLSLKNSEGFIKIVGEVGTGKTILCRKLLSLLDSRFKVVYVPNPYLSPSELKQLLAEQIGVEQQASKGTHQLLIGIYRKLLSIAKQRKQVVLIIDEAQAMPRKTLEALRLLSNLETEKRKLIQVVLIGQPELDAMLNRADLRQLKQRIIFSEYLLPLTYGGAKKYLRHRLQAVGCERHLFSRLSYWLIYKASGGVPRLINIIAHKALIAAFGEGEAVVNSAHVAKAIADTSEAHWKGKLAALRWRLLWPAFGGACCMAFLPQWLGGLS